MCMREHGVKDFPDPNPDGIVQINGGTDTPKFGTAGGGG
jgi:hypothetical protein